MKPYQHHDEYHDIGKAAPVPKAPNPARRPAERGRLLGPTSRDGTTYAQDFNGVIRRTGPHPVDIKREARAK